MSLPSLITSKVLRARSDLVSRQHQEFPGAAEIAYCYGDRAGHVCPLQLN